MKVSHAVCCRSQFLVFQGFNPCNKVRQFLVLFSESRCLVEGFSTFTNLICSSFFSDLSVEQVENKEESSIEQMQIEEDALVERVKSREGGLHGFVPAPDQACVDLEELQLPRLSSSYTDSEVGTTGKTFRMPIC